MAVVCAVSQPGRRDVRGRDRCLGLGGGRDWPTSAAFADLDGDGDLDLYVCHYCAWDADRSPPCPTRTIRDKFTYCGPRVFAAMPDHVFRNDGGRFVDVSERAGVRAADREGRGLGVVAAHLDDDDRIDLFVANDMSANFLFGNRGGFRFEETGAESGVATNAEGVTWPAWAWPAATSTATAGSTWR